MKQIFNGAPPPGRGGSDGGSSAASSGVPPAPRLDSSGARSDSLVISWQWPSAPPRAQYELCWRESPSSGMWQRERLSVGEAAFSAHVVRPLQPNTTYTIAVQVLPPGGGAGPRGAELVATTAPAVPQLLECCGSTHSSISLRWRPVTGSSVRYAVYGSAALSFAKVYSGVDTFCEVSGLTRGKEYGFRVCAMNAHGGASDFSPEVLVRAEPSSGSGARRGGGGGGAHDVVPELLTLSHDALSMRWAPPPGGATNYIVELAEGEEGEVLDEEWAVIYEGAPPGCEISYLAPRTEYHLRVACTDHSGRTSAFGTPLVVTTPREPEKKKKAAPKKRSAAKDTASKRPPSKAPAPAKVSPPSRTPRHPPPKPAPSPRHSSPGRAAGGGGSTPRNARQPPKPSPSPRRSAPPGPGYMSPRKPAIPSPRRASPPSREAPPSRTVRRPPPSPSPRPRPAQPRRAPARSADDTAADSDDDESGRRSPRRSTGGSIHERLYSLHQEALQRQSDAREQVRQSLSQSHLSLRDKASIAMRPKSAEGSMPFGSTASRPHLWLGANAAAGPTTDAAAEPGSPRGSRRGSGLGSQVAPQVEPVVPDSPGPGAYDAKPGFKTDLRKDPSRGAASAFKSKTKRLFTADGGIIEAEVFPGKVVSDSPGVGTYAPKLASSIGVAAAAIARQAEKLQNIRRRSSAPSRASFANNLSRQVTPGPNAYEPGKVAAAKARRVYEVTNAAFRSGSRRSLPWGGAGKDAPRSSRARTAPDADPEAEAEPGPGEYALPGAFVKAAVKPRGKGGAGAWTKGAPRFAAEPADDKLTPSSVHYTPNYSQCSSSARI